MKIIGSLLCVAVLAVLPACKSGAPAQSAEDAADQISAHLAQGEKSAADDIYKGVSSSERHRDIIYSTLYAHASQHYEEGNYAAATRMFRFLAQHYPKAVAVQESLLYAMFLERAGRPDLPSPEQVKEMASTLDELRRREKAPPHWLDLVATQLAIDQGRLDQARTHLTRFKGKWDGTPVDLHSYITELDRYLDTHVEMPR